MSHELHGRRILVVSDGPTGRAAAELLEPYGCIVDVAATGADSLERVERAVYDLVLADLKLPDMRGTDLFRQLRASRTDLPVILLLSFGYDVSPLLAPARNAGLNSVLYKPFRARQLIDEITKAVGCAQPAAPPESNHTNRQENSPL